MDHEHTLFLCARCKHQPDIIPEKTGHTVKCPYCHEELQEPVFDYAEAITIWNAKQFNNLLYSIGASFA